MTFLVLGSWSDRVGRKYCLLINTAGAAVECAVYIFVFYNKNLRSEFMLIGSAICGVTGGLMGNSFACTGYICDITTEESRTFRMALMYSIVPIGQIVGTYLGSALIVFVSGFGILFFIWTATSLVGVLYIQYMIKVIIPEQQEKNQSEEQQKETKIRQIFQVSLISQSIKSFISKRPGYTRARMIIFTLALTIGVFSLVGKLKRCLKLVKLY